ncbi:hypothetical protein, partial [Acinetobacter baumannii]|uniref:hypothetical protein n=1 Tax=Acinetobacter baumannii TaxID=470 RepID=UPI001BB467B2
VKAAPLLRLGGASWADRSAPVPDCVDPALGIFDTMLACDGRIGALADHLARLEASCLELFGRYLPDGLSARLVAAAGT